MEDTYLKFEPDWNRRSGNLFIFCVSTYIQNYVHKWNKARPHPLPPKFYNASKAEEMRMGETR